MHHCTKGAKWIILDECDLGAERNEVATSENDTIYASVVVYKYYLFFNSVCVKRATLRILKIFTIAFTPLCIDKYCSIYVRKMILPSCDCHPRFARAVTLSDLHRKLLCLSKGRKMNFRVLYGSREILNIPIVHSVGKVWAIWSYMRAIYEIYVVPAPEPNSGYSVSHIFFNILVP